jgi:hypothetical protein
LSRDRTDYKALQNEYLKKKRTLSDISVESGLSSKTIRKRFDAIEVQSALKSPTNKDPINLIFDATYFGRAYGFIAFHDTHRIIYHQEIKSETIDVIRDCLQLLIDAGYTFKSFTIDGRRGVVKLLEGVFPGVPIQICHFHQKAIITRYLTSRPRSLCGKELRQLALNLHNYTQIEFQQKLCALKEKHALFLAELNSNGKPLHSRIIAAFRSLKTNLTYLFTYKNHPELNIPNTTNIIENNFSHLKQNINIHRGLNTKRKKILINKYFSSPL